MNSFRNLAPSLHNLEHRHAVASAGSLGGREFVEVLGDVVDDDGVAVEDGLEGGVELEVEVDVDGHDVVGAVGAGAAGLLLLSGAAAGLLLLVSILAAGGAAGGGGGGGGLGGDGGHLLEGSGAGVEVRRESVGDLFQAVKLEWKELDGDDESDMLLCMVMCLKRKRVNTREHRAKKFLAPPHLSLVSLQYLATIICTVTPKLFPSCKSGKRERVSK